MINFSTCEPLFLAGDVPFLAALVTAHQPRVLGFTNPPRQQDTRCGKQQGEETGFLVGMAGRCPLWSQPFQTVLVSRANGQWCQSQLGPQYPRLAEPLVKIFIALHMQVSCLLWPSQSFWKIPGIPFFLFLLLKLARIGSVTCR